MPSDAENRRDALIRAARLARVGPGADYDEAAACADAAAQHLLHFMRLNGEFALGLLQASSYLLSGSLRDDYQTLQQVSTMTDRAIRAAPNNPDIVRRAYTIFTRMSPDAPGSAADVILTDANWETLPQSELLE